MGRSTLLGVGRPPVSGAFNPLSLSPYVLLNPDTFGLADLAAVGTASDSSGNGRNFTQANGSNKPTYHTNDLNTHATVQHDGGDRYVVGPDLSAITGGAYGVIVVKLDADPPASNLDGLWHFSAGGQTHFPFQGDGTIYDGFGSTIRRSTGVDPTPALTSYRIYSVRSQTSEWKAWIDGSSIYTDTGSNTPGFPTAPQIGRGSITNVLKGRWAWFGIFPAINDTQHGQLVTYLQARFAI